MSHQLIRPSILIKETWQSFLKTWDTTVRYSAWYIAISALSATVAYLKGGQAGTQFIGAILQVIAMLASLYLSVRIYQVIFSIEDKKPLANTSSNKIWKIVGQMLISIVLISVPVILSMGIIAVAIMVGSSSLIGITISSILVLAFIITLIYAIAVRLSFAQAHIIDKTEGVLNAYKYSWKITKNKFWAIFGRTLLAGLIFGLLVVALSITAIIIVSLVSGVDIASAMSKPIPSPAISSMTELIQGIIMAAILPLFYIFKIKLYRDVEKTN